MSTTDRSRTPAAASLAAGVATFGIADVLRRLVEPADASTAALAAAVHEHMGVWLAAGSLAIVSALLLVPGALATRLLAPGRGAALARIGSALVVVGAIASTGHTIGYYGTYATYAGSGLDAGTLDRLATTADVLGGIVIALFMLGMIVGPILLGIGLRRAGVVPIWVPVLAVLFAVAGGVSGLAAGVVSLAAGVAAFGYVAWRLARPATVDIESTALVADATALAR